MSHLLPLRLCSDVRQLCPAVPADERRCAATAAAAAGGGTAAGGDARWCGAAGASGGAAGGVRPAGAAVCGAAGVAGFESPLLPSGCLLPWSTPPLPPFLLLSPRLYPPSTPTSAASRLGGLATHPPLSAPSPCHGWAEEALRLSAAGGSSHSHSRLLSPPSTYPHHPSSHAAGSQSQQRLHTRARSAADGQGEGDTAGGGLSSKDSEAQAEWSRSHPSMQQLRLHELLRLQEEEEEEEERKQRTSGCAAMAPARGGAGGAGEGGGAAGREGEQQALSRVLRHQLLLHLQATQQQSPACSAYPSAGSAKEQLGIGRVDPTAHQRRPLSPAPDTISPSSSPMSPPSSSPHHQPRWAELHQLQRHQPSSTSSSSSSSSSASSSYSPAMSPGCGSLRSVPSPYLSGHQASASSSRSSSYCTLFTASTDSSSCGSSSSSSSSSPNAVDSSREQPTAGRASHVVEQAAAAAAAWPLQRWVQSVQQMQLHSSPHASAVEQLGLSGEAQLGCAGGDCGGGGGAAAQLLDWMGEEAAGAATAEPACSSSYSWPAEAAGGAGQEGAALQAMHAAACSLSWLDLARLSASHSSQLHGEVQQRLLAAAQLRAEEAELQLCTVPQPRAADSTAAASTSPHPAASSPPSSLHSPPLHVPSSAVVAACASPGCCTHCPLRLQAQAGHSQPHTATSSSDADTTTSSQQHSSSSPSCSSHSQQHGLSSSSSSAGRVARAKRRRKAAELEEHERWYCPHAACTRVFRRNSTWSIRNHLHTCAAAVAQLSTAQPHSTHHALHSQPHASHTHTTAHSTLVTFTSDS